VIDPFTLIVGGIALLSGALSYKAARDAQKQAKKAAESMAGVLVNKESNIEAIPVIYGERRVGGTRVFVHTEGGDKNEFLYIALVLCEGEVESITDIEIDDYSITDARFQNVIVVNKPGGGGTTLTSSLIEAETFTGADNQAASSILSETSKWGASHQLNGVAYIALKLKWDENVFSGIPDITALVKGRKVLDPRTGTTAWSNNPALCIRDYLTNNRYGKGLPSSVINDTLFNAAATDCESFSVTPYSGATENIDLFQCNAVIDTDEEIFRNVERMLLGCRGFLPYSQGKYGLVIDQATSSVMTLTTNEIIGGINIQGESKKDKFNRVLVKFPNPQADWQPDQAVWPDAGSAEETQFLAEDGGTLLVDEVDIETITNYYSARDFARILCLRSRNALRCSLKATSEAMNLVVGDVVSVTHPTPAFSAKPFQVEEVTLNYDGTVDLNLIEYDSTLYAYDPASEETEYPDTTLPDPSVTEAPTVLVLTPSSEILGDGSINAYVDIAWTASDDAFVVEYEVRVFITGSSQAFEQRTQDSAIRIGGLTAGVEYNVTVVAINSNQIRSGTLSDTFTAVGDAVAPGPPTDVVVQGNFKAIDIFWTNPSDLDLSHVEVHESTTSTFDDGEIIGRSSGNKYSASFPNAIVTRYYWVRSVDTSGNVSDWVSGGDGTTLLLGGGDFDNGIIGINFFVPDLQDTITGYQTQINAKADEIDVDQILEETQDIGDTLDTVAERMLNLAVTQSDTLGLVSDAGITVDPSTGSVTIQAVETLRTEVDSRVNQVEIDLDAAEAEIVLKASVTYVDNAIAAAVLDSADLAALTALQAQVNQAEIDIDANESAIALKADQTSLNALDVRLNSAEIDIDGLQSTITLKANETDLTAVEDRVTTAEITLGALDVAQISQTVVDTISLKQALDLSAVTDLQSLLYQYNTRETLKTDIAYAQQTISADVTDNREAIAQARLELAAAIDANTATIVSEQSVRASEDAALASDITQLEARVDANESGVSGNATAITNLTARVTTAEGTITSQSTDITELENNLSGLTTTVAGNTTNITANTSAVNALTSRVTANETTITAQASDITDLEASLTAAETNITGNATAITSLDTRVTSAEGSITSQASAITTLQSSVGNNTAAISTNATTINGVTAQYSVTIDNNDHISGFGLISDIIDEQPTSQFIVSADAFAIGGTGSASDTYPFVVYPTGATVDGVTIPAGAYMDSAFINYLSADKIEAGTLNLGNQDGMAVRQGKESYTTTGSGFWLGNDGGDPKFIIGSGNDYIAFNGDSGDITARGITIRDTANRVVFDTNEFDGTYIKNATIDTAQIADAAIESAKIDDLAVSTVKIQDQAVTIPESAYTVASTTSNTLQTLTVACTGAPVEILASCSFLYTGTSFTTPIQVNIKRDGTIIGSTSFLPYSNRFPDAICFAVSDSRTTEETRTYTVEVAGSVPHSAEFRYLRTLETKK